MPAPGSTGAPPATTHAAPVPAPTDALIATNGVCERVSVKGTFPTDENIFRLVSIAKNGKSVEVGIVGGSFDNGHPTATLKLGEKITLVNTADGTRYEIVLKTSCNLAAPAGSSTTTQSTTTTPVAPAPRRPLPRHRPGHDHGDDADRDRLARHDHPDGVARMASYAYTAINAAGLELRGEVQAPTAAAAREQLRVQGLLAEQPQEVSGRLGRRERRIVRRAAARRRASGRSSRASSRSSRGSSRP